MLMPRKVRHRKTHRGRMTGIAKGGTRVTFGDYGIQALEPGWITNRQIEAARIAMTRYIKRGGKVWINIFPDKPVTQKPAETRMGSGKGNPEHWVAVVKPGRVMFELSGVPEPTAREAMRLAMHKLPIKTPFVVRQDEAMMACRAAELRELNDTELEHRLGEAKEELFNLRFQNATGQLDNIARLPQVRARRRPHRDAAARARDRRGRAACEAQERTMADETSDRARTTRRKVREGIVVSTKMDKTVVVAVIDRVRHRRYGKTHAAHEPPLRARRGQRRARGRPRPHRRDPPDVEAEALARRGSPRAGRE